jgi:hypothetical protein
MPGHELDPSPAASPDELFVRPVRLWPRAGLNVLAALAKLGLVAPDG